MIRARCVSAVRIEIESNVAISGFVWPRAKSRSTSCSRGESGSVGRASGRAAHPRREVAALRAEARDVVVRPTLVEFTGLLLGSVGQQVAHHAPCRS